MKNKMYMFLVFMIGLTFGFILFFVGSIILEDNHNEDNREYDVGKYLNYARKINGTEFQISSKLTAVFDRAGVKEQMYDYCLDKFEKCNVQETDCSKEDLPLCMIKEDVYNFNSYKNGGDHVACVNCPSRRMLSNELERGDYDKEIVEKIKKVTDDEDIIDRCYYFIKDLCKTDVCPIEFLILPPCLTAEDAEEHFRTYKASTMTDEELGEEIRQGYEYDEFFNKRS